MFGTQFQTRFKRNFLSPTNTTILDELQLFTMFVQRNVRTIDMHRRDDRILNSLVYI